MDEKLVKRVNLKNCILHFKEHNIHQDFDIIQVKFSTKYKLPIVCGICQQNILEKDLLKANCYAFITLDGQYLTCMLKIKETERNCAHLYFFFFILKIEIKKNSNKKKFKRYHQQCIFSYLVNFDSSEKYLCKSCNKQNIVQNKIPSKPVIGFGKSL